MKCKQCHEDYAQQFYEDFANGICLPCQVQNSHDKWWAKIENELATYNSTHNTDYDFNSFCYDSSIAIIKHKDLGDYQELKKVCKAEGETWEEYRKRNLQPELPF